MGCQTMAINSAYNRAVQGNTSSLRAHCCRVALHGSAAFCGLPCQQVRTTGLEAVVVEGNTALHTTCCNQALRQMPTVFAETAIVLLMQLTTCKRHSLASALGAGQLTVKLLPNITRQYSTDEHGTHLETRPSH